ncbi:MAG: hypothetical protein NC228_09540, partial [[Eubacterium] siraeum]|nr:hypothetical protein [[Eubacterium] siraeum]
NGDQALKSRQSKALPDFRIWRQAAKCGVSLAENRPKGGFSTSWDKNSWFLSLGLIIMLKVKAQSRLPNENPPYFSSNHSLTTTASSAAISDCSEILG